MQTLTTQSERTLNQPANLPYANPEPRLNQLYTIPKPPSTYSEPTRSKPSLLYHAINPKQARSKPYANLKPTQNHPKPTLNPR